MKKNPDPAVSTVTGAAAIDAPPAVNPPPPPGGGRWRWTGVEWEDLNPPPVVVDDTASNQTAPE